MNAQGEKYESLQAVPCVIIYNNLETFYPFLSRIGDASILEPRKYRGDRALFWLGKQKLVITSSPIPDAPMICERYGYQGTQAIAPEISSLQLSLDIMRETRLVEKIVEFAGPGKTVQLVPYATTQELYSLADFLRDQHGLTVYLTESPAEPDLWIRDLVDTKLGFRELVKDWISDTVKLPRGFAVQELKSASQVVAWFMRHGVDCVVKPDRGESGLGIQYFDHTQLHPNILSELQSNAFIDGDCMIVEEYIWPKAGLSPSLELFVPPSGSGEPYITYISNQQFGQLARFSGVVVSKTFLEATWAQPLIENGLRIAAQLQEMGYTGHFDLDTVIDQQDQVYLLEINARRTGGTHAHEFGEFTFSKDYLDEVAILSTNRVESREIHTLDQLLDILAPVLFPIQSEKRGIVITVSSTLHLGDFGCIVCGRDIPDLFEIKEQMEALLQRTVFQPVAWVAMDA